MSARPNTLAIAKAWRGLVETAMPSSFLCRRADSRGSVARGSVPASMGVTTCKRLQGNFVYTHEAAQA
ncbi:hypothetical protein GCM10027280_24860 [Micromonospora polyrhachis]